MGIAAEHQWGSDGPNNRNDHMTTNAEVLVAAVNYLPTNQHT